MESGGKLTRKASGPEAGAATFRRANGERIPMPHRNWSADRVKAERARLRDMLSGR